MCPPTFENINNIVTLCVTTFHLTIKKRGIFCEILIFRFTARTNRSRIYFVPETSGTKYIWRKLDMENMEKTYEVMKKLKSIKESMHQMMQHQLKDLTLTRHGHRIAYEE
jgi:hypothetical protein